LPQPPRLPLRSNHPLEFAVRGEINKRFTRRSIPRESQVATCPLVKSNSRFAIPRYKVQKSSAGKEMLAPPAGSLPLPRWAQGPLSVPYRPGTLAYKFQVKTKREAYKSHDPTCPQPQHEPHSLGQLRGRHVSCGASSRCPARGSSGVTTCPAAPAPAAQPGAAPRSPRVLRHQLPLPSPGQLRGHHVPCGTSSHCPARGSSGVATCPAAPAPAAQPGAATGPPRVP
jgi:hypothetical protein